MRAKRGRDDAPVTVGDINSEKKTTHARQKDSKKDYWFVGGAGRQKLRHGKSEGRFHEFRRIKDERVLCAPQLGKRGRRNWPEGKRRCPSIIEPIGFEEGSD